MAMSVRRQPERDSVPQRNKDMELNKQLPFPVAATAVLLGCKIVRFQV